MKVFVISDVHLKPWMFREAEKWMEKGIADQVVCLMDLADEWNEQHNRGLYGKTYDEAITFAKKYPHTLWCYGNHDLSYFWNKWESGYSYFAKDTVQRKLLELRATVQADNLKYVHKIDNVLFSHGGVLNLFVEENVPPEVYDDVDEVIRKINSLGSIEMWTNNSPIWLRPQKIAENLYKSDEILQVVGHTPMKMLTKQKNLISCDVFSTHSNGKPTGTQEYLLLDTETWEFEGIPMI